MSEFGVSLIGRDLASCPQKPKLGRYDHISRDVFQYLFHAAFGLKGLSEAALTEYWEYFLSNSSSYVDSAGGKALKSEVPCLCPIYAAKHPDCLSAQLVCTLQGMPGDVSCM